MGFPRQAAFSARLALDRSGLSEAIAVAMRFGYLFDFPEYPHKGYAQADDDTEEQQRQTGGCEHLKHA
jgi:hypothetical protein